jgi:hypothetical protein
MFKEFSAGVQEAQHVRRARTPRYSNIQTAS